MRKRKKAISSTFKRLSPGEFLVTVPSGYAGPLSAEDAIRLMVIADLLDDPEPKPPTPNRGSNGVPAPSGVELRKLHEQRRLATLQRIARSQRELNALTDNEGLDRVVWRDEGQQEVSRTRSRAREARAGFQPFEG